MAGTFALGIAAAVALVGTAACVPKASLRQTDVMRQSGAVSSSALELRARVNELADRLAGRIAETAGRIEAAAEDPAIRRGAVAFKADAIPALYTAAFRTDPLTGLVDVWVLAFQIDQFLTDGAGRDMFGPQQPLAREGARVLLAEADAAVQEIAAGPEAFARHRARFESWAREHPLESSFSTRASVTTLMAGLRAEERDAFAAVGAVTETVENLSERLNTYANLLPRQARWQAELLAADLAAQYDVEGLLSEVRALGGVAQRADDLMSQVPDLLGGSSIPELVADERRAVLAGVGEERTLALEFMTEERLAVLAALRDERIAALEALRQERIATLQEAEALRKRAWDEAVGDMRQLVDYTLLRVALLVLLLMLAAATIGVVGYRLTLGRRA